MGTQTGTKTQRQEPDFEDGPDPDDERDNGAPPDKPANIAPDAVKDPNEKTEGHPGLPAGSKHRKPGHDDADPGGG